MESVASGDPYLLSGWAAFASTVETLAGDAAGALRIAQRGLSEKLGHAFVFQHPYHVLAWHWASAVTGHDPSGAAAESERIITTSLLDPPRTGAAAWNAPLCEMWLAAEALDRADAALQRAEQLLDALGQRYAEGFILLPRARLLQARGEPPATVRVAAEHARALSIKRGAFLFAGRAEELVTE